MLNGIFRYTGENNPYDRGRLRVKITETPATFRLEVIERDMYTEAHTCLLFKRDIVYINKARSPHAIRWGADWFVIYPYRAGVPCIFEREEAGSA